MESRTIVQALRQALVEEMDRDSSVILLGEDIAVFGGAYRVTEGLLARYGESRVRDTPISEAGIVGAGVGAAMTGLRPVVEIQFNDFLACAMDQVCNQAAKMRFMMGGQVKVPLVIRAPVGATGRAAQHSQSLEAWFMHTPGLKVVFPCTPYDAKGLLASAIRDDNPVMFFEHKLLYGGSSPGGKAKTAVDGLGDAFRAAPEGEYLVPLGVADIKRVGRDVTIVATGLTLHKSLAAADILAGEGIEAEVIDPRTLVPLDRETILASVRRTGRLVVASEDQLTCGVASEIAAIVAEEALWDLDAPIRRVSVPDTPIPFAPAQEHDVLPQTETIVKAVRSIMGGPPGGKVVSTAWIFDFDGVLVNTMETHFACYSQALAEAGVPVDKAQFFSQAGMTGREQITWFARKAGISVDADAVYRRKGEIFREREPEAEKIDCMVELFHTLRAAGQRLAIATGSSRPSVQPVIDKYDLAPAALVTSEDVKRGKPHPDLFLTAAEKLGVPAEQCIVVEDSDVGIECAKRAGMRALRFFDQP